MSILVIDDNTRQDLKNLAAYAENNEYSFDDLLDIMNGAMEPPGHDTNFFCVVPVGYKVCYTIEQQPSFKMRHASISVGGPDNKLPHPVAIQAIIDELGFNTKLGSNDPNTHIHLKEPGCINILEKIT